VSAPSGQPTPRRRAQPDSQHRPGRPPLSGSRATVSGSGPTRSRANEQFGGTRDISRPPLPEPLPVPVVDNHCHLDIEDGASWLDPTSALEMATSVGVDRIVQIGCDLPGAAWAVRTAERFDAIVAGVALHPNEAPKLAAAGELDVALAEIEQLVVSSDRVRAVGETGLDYYRTGPEGTDAQRNSFSAHIRLAHEHDKTLVIHDRDAHDDVLAMLDEHGLPDRTVLHCFSGDADFARRCLDRGAYLSFAGTVTFKNAGHLREALAIAPRDRILVETDAPFLTPMPYRGRPNASYLVPLTVRTMADIRGDDLESLCAAISANTDAAFGGAWGSPRLAG
jgi:TatD DNase family protein